MKSQNQIQKPPAANHKHSHDGFSWSLIFVIIPAKRNGDETNEMRDNIPNIAYITADMFSRFIFSLTA